MAASTRRAWRNISAAAGAGGMAWHVRQQPAFLNVIGENGGISENMVPLHASAAWHRKSESKSMYQRKK